MKKSLILILNGINLDAQDVHGKTALHYAVASDCVELVKVLLKNKSSVDIKDNNGSTVKDMITKSSVNPEIVRYSQPVHLHVMCWQNRSLV